MLAEAYLQMMQQQATATPTALERQKRESVMRMITLLLKNGAMPADRERRHFDALSSLLPQLKKEFRDAKRVGADRIALRGTLQRSTTTGDTVCLSFWADPDLPICYGLDCKRRVSKKERVRYCASCGLSYCRKCQSQERDGGDAESMQSGTVVRWQGIRCPVVCVQDVPLGNTIGMMKHDDALWTLGSGYSSASVHILL